MALQDSAGWWKAELETNVTMDAEDLLLREFLGIGDAAAIGRAANWIRSQQREDGSWANFYGAPANLSTTVEAYAVLRLAGDEPEAAHMAAARESVLAAGGIENARVFTHIWLALFGLWEWDDVPALPPELIFLPPWFPLNIYDFACWARQTIAALTIVRAERPVRPLPFGLDELRTGRPVKPRPRTFRGRVLLWLDRVGRVYERHPLKPLRRRALARVERWVLERQEDDGSWGGIQPPWVYSLMALSLRGHDVSEGAVKKGLDGIERFLIQEGDMRRLEACQSPVWDTALAMIALSDAGVPSDDPALVKAADWLLGEEVRIKATGRSAGRSSPRADGRSSSTTTTTRTSTTPPRSCWHSVGSATRNPSALTRRSAAAPNGPSACRARTAAGGRSTPTTCGRCAATSRFATSAR